jgi:predicted lactoylglutathione lyase
MIMSRQIFINLPARDVDKAEAFYTALGAIRNPQFSDDTLACVVCSDTAFIMLMIHPKWQHFTQQPIPDAHRKSKILFAFSVADGLSVDQMVDAADTRGSTANINPTQDRVPFMCGRSFEVWDGQMCEVISVDVSQARERSVEMGHDRGRVRARVAARIRPWTTEGGKKCVWQLPGKTFRS